MRSRVPIVAGCLVGAIAVIAGCSSGPSAAASNVQAQLFAPRAVRIHPVFTKVIDWSGNSLKPDGIEALIELHDQFGDPCKGAGLFTFELFRYASGQPDPRGDRICNPWQASVVTEDEQRERWSKTGRSYAFRLQADRISPTAPYVFTVTFSPADGGPRMFDQVVLGTLATQPTHTQGRRDDGTVDPGGTPPSSGDQKLPAGTTPPVQ